MTPYAVRAVSERGLAQLFLLRPKHPLVALLAVCQSILSPQKGVAAKAGPSKDTEN